MKAAGIGRICIVAMDHLLEIRDRSRDPKSSRNYQSGFIGIGILGESMGSGK